MNSDETIYNMAVYDQIIKQSNSRHLHGWYRWLDIFFSKYQWARRLIGGKWELWWVECVYSEIWHPVENFYEDCYRRPSPICRGTPLKEEWPN